MTEPTLHATPHLRDVFRAQFRLVRIMMRWPAIAAAVLLIVPTMIVIRGLFGDGDVVDFHPERLIVPALGGLLLPFALWRGEDVFGSGFLWTLPTDRRAHVLVRVAAGWLWLMAAIAVLVLWLLIVALVTGGNFIGAETLQVIPARFVELMNVFPYPDMGELDNPATETVQWKPHPLLWLTPFTAATGIYLLTSAVMLGMRLKWRIAVVVGFFALIPVIELIDNDFLLRLPTQLLRPVFLGPYGLDQLITARTEYLKIGVPDSVSIWRGVPNAGDWTVATLLWMAAGLLAIWLAASRHREERGP